MFLACAGPVKTTARTARQSADDPSALASTYPPRPSHSPHVGHLGSEAPAWIGEQVPCRPTSLHERQGPVQLVLQQAPSAQCLDPHSSFDVQTGGSNPSPHEAFTHLRPLTQSKSLAQVGKQLFDAGSQENGVQTVDAPNLQCPSPSHTLIFTIASPAHTPGVHTVPGS